jgi:hypothetical protein
VNGAATDIKRRAAMQKSFVILFLGLIFGSSLLVIGHSIDNPKASVLDELSGKWKVLSFVAGPPGYTAGWGEATIARTGRTVSFQTQIQVGQQTYKFEIMIRSENNRPLLSVKHDFPGPSIEDFVLSATEDGGLAGKGAVRWDNRETSLDAGIYKNDKGEVEFSFAFNGATTKTDLGELREKPLYTFTFKNKVD